MPVVEFCQFSVLHKLKQILVFFQFLIIFKSEYIHNQQYMRKKQTKLFSGAKMIQNRNNLRYLSIDERPFFC